MSLQKMDFGKPAVSDDIIGIDLGTTNSAVSIYTADTVPTILPLQKRGFTIQSCVRWDGRNEDGEPTFTVGEEAYKERYRPNVVYSVKRIMGSGDTVTLTWRTEPPYPSKADSDWDDSLDLQLTPAEVSSIILHHIKEKVAELYKPVKKCVITVPAYFNQRQIEDTLKAAELAELDCVQILKEPTSASYIYSQLGYAGSGSVLIYDLGGGTFDVTHMNFLRKDAIPSKMLTSLKRQYGIELKASTGTDVNDQYFCRVLGTYGDVRLGGDDIDKAMGDAIIKKLKLKFSEEDKEQLYLRCEEFKKMSIEAMDIKISEHTVHLDRQDLYEATDKIFNKTVELMKGIDMSDVSTVVLVGGSTKSQRIRDNLSKVFPGVEISAVLDPDATVALGAGSVAKAIANKKDLAYADVLPLPIGILVDEKEVQVCIERNTSMPFVATEYFSTMYDNQKTITLHVFQGVSKDPSKCTYLGRLSVEDLPAKKAGEVVASVSFILSSQGRLRITSTVDGVDKEVELIIDNIFNVEHQEFRMTPDTAEKRGDTFRILSSSDDFEEAFMPLLQEDLKAIEMFSIRRRLIKAGEDATDIEDQIAELAMGAAE